LDDAHTDRQGPDTGEEVAEVLADTDSQVLMERAEDSCVYLSLLATMFLRSENSWSRSHSRMPLQDAVRWADHRAALQLRVAADRSAPHADALFVSGRW
jgi:hypothetical protein